MTAPGLAPTDDLSPARWLVDEITTFGGRVDQLLPQGYAAHLRVFHRPDQGRPDAGSAGSWAEVARRHGTVLHPEAQWLGLTRGQHGSPHSDSPEASSDEPLLGSLDPLTLPRLATHLAAHTSTPDACWFAMWEGTGTAPRSWEPYPRFGLPGRDHWLFPAVPVAEIVAVSVELEVAGQEESFAADGELAGLVVLAPGGTRPTQAQASADWIAWQRREGLLHSPSWWWPQDRAWVVHSEVDYDSTLIACGTDLARALLDDPEVECLPVEAGTCLYANADTVNVGAEGP